MSHQPERKEKNCLNCGAQVFGRFCHVCGQENIIPRQNFWSLTKHFIYDIFHFDGKFFETVKYLFTKPGKVPKEYIAGKRNSYLDPIRMYLFTSAIFFIIFFSVRDSTGFMTTGKTKRISRVERFTEAAKVKSQLDERPSDSALLYKMNLLLDTTIALELQSTEANKINDSFHVNLRNNTYNLIPSKDTSDFHFISKSNNWFERQMKKRWNEQKSTYGDDEGKIITELMNELLHKLPYLLFISLPLFALLLKLLYKRRQNFYYSDHAVFTLYHYIISFILFLISLLVSALNNKLQWGIFDLLSTIIKISWLVYLFISLKIFYGDPFLKTFGKFILLIIMAFFVIAILFGVFLLFSFAF